MASRIQLQWEQRKRRKWKTNATKNSYADPCFGKFHDIGPSCVLFGVIIWSLALLYYMLGFEPRTPSSSSPTETFHATS